MKQSIRPGHSEFDAGWPAFDTSTLFWSRAHRSAEIFVVSIDGPKLFFWNMVVVVMLLLLVFRRFFVEKKKSIPEVGPVVVWQFLPWVWFGTTTCSSARTRRKLCPTSLCCFVPMVSLRNIDDNPTATLKKGLGRSGVPRWDKLIWWVEVRAHIYYWILVSTCRTCRCWDMGTNFY